MMIKRFIAAGLAVVFGRGCVPAYGGEEQVSAAGTEASAEDIFEKYDVVNGVMRYDCLVGIMKAAGLQAETFIYDYNITIDSYFYEDSDYYSYPYAELAKKLDITTGEEGTNKYGTVKQYFYPERIATVSECVSFMLPVMGYSSGVIDYDSAFETAKDVGLIKEDDGFYTDGDITLTYEIYTTLLKRMLNSKRYMYFTELNNNTYISKDKYRFFDESGEMTYLDYLVSCCPEDLSKSQNTEEGILKYYNIISVPYLTCLTAVTKIAGMRVDGLFKDDDKRAAIVDASCLEGSELEIVKWKGYFLDNEANYGREIIIFSQTYGIVSSQQDSRLSFHENADISVCVDYIMHILADISEDMTL
ncbi:MAG: hypothetical protein LIO44_00120 [Eubacterium sp.]|nr:hypothetical protein [Eubacterium sp.]